MDKKELQRIDTCPTCNSSLTAYSVSAKRKHIQLCKIRHLPEIQKEQKTAEAETTVLGSLEEVIGERWFSLQYPPSWMIAREEVAKEYPRAELASMCSGGDLKPSSLLWAIVSSNHSAQRLLLSKGWFPTAEEAWESAANQIKELGKEEVVKETTKPKTLQSTQHGGDHYKGLVIEPAEYCQKNKFQFCESSAIKYLSRFRSKKGAEDLKKAMHFISMCLEFEYGVVATTSYSDD